MNAPMDERTSAGRIWVPTSVKNVRRSRFDMRQLAGEMRSRVIEASRLGRP